MKFAFDPELRELEVLRAIGGGAATYTAIMPCSAYENLCSLRRLCGLLVRTGHLETWMCTKPLVRRNFSRWGHGPKACHFRLTAQGEERLAELERAIASRSVETAAS